MTRKVRLWATIGVSMTTFKAHYVRPPQVQPEAGGDWQTVEATKLDSLYTTIAVDEFAEIELDQLRVLTRDELRKICDTHPTKAAILAALAAIR